MSEIAASAGYPIAMGARKIVAEPLTMTCFFFSRRRRHTIFDCDWSSDVCSSDLTAPKFDTNQLHAAVVELVALERADIKYSTVQNWYAGDERGVGGIYNFVTKRGLCKGANSRISWTQVETGSAITWKYPSCVLLGDNSVGEFYSVA